MSTESIWTDGLTSAPKPPSAAGWPILGGALQMMKDPLQYLVQQYQELGPVFEVKALNRQFIVLAGPEANLFMSKHGDNYLSGRDSWTTFADEIDSKYFLAMTEGKIHSRQRKIIKKPYSRSAILTKLPELVAITHKFAQGWRADTPFVVFPTMQRLVAEQIGQLLLGSGPDEYFDDFVVFMRTLLNAVLGQRPKFFLRLPGYRNAKAEVMKLAQELLDTHRGNPNTDDPDLIDYLLAEVEGNEDILAEPELLIGAIGPYLAGIDTAAGSTSFMLYALLKNEGVIERLLPEIDDAFANGPLTAKILRRMPLLKAATIETLRMYPVAPMLPRHVTKPFTFAGHQLNVGDPVMLGMAVSHYDPQLYPNPDQYDIDRCLPPRKEHRQPGALAPYGLGAHTCAGAGFAEVEIMITVATLLHHFHLEMVPADYTLRTTYSPSPAPDSRFQIRAMPR